MSFEEVRRDGHLIGHAFATPYAYFFFGTRHFQKSQQSQYFPEYDFAYLKQVHGKAIVEANPQITPEADAQFTGQKHLALISQTADCTPVLLANHGMVCAIHSGWRGTELNIVSQARVAFTQSPPLLAAIGPHILRNSFEVGLDVSERLERAPGGNGLALPHADPGKRYFDLSQMIRRQLRKAFGEALPIIEHLDDTVTDPLYHSFRRDKQRAGRQFSFVVLNSQKDV